MTLTSTQITSGAKTVQVQDIEGRMYIIDQEQLLQAAQQCIREQFASDQVPLTSPDHARELIQVLIGHYEHEVFMAVWLDNKHKTIHHEVMFRGTIDASAVYPREVVKAGLKHNAAAVIFAHNHPSGDTEPSNADIAITKKLKKALALVDMRVLDHLIVGESVTSMAEKGLV